MTKFDDTAENGGSPRLRPTLDGSVDSTTAPVQYLTRREAREAERRAAAAREAAVATTAEVPEAVAPTATTVAAAESTALPALPEPTAPAVAPLVTASTAPAAAPVVEAAPAEVAVESAAPTATATAAATVAAPARGRRAAAAAPRRSTHQPGPARRGQAAARAGVPAATSSPAVRRQAQRTAAAARPADRAALGRATKKVTVLGSMLFAGGMLVATSVPALAFQVDAPVASTARASLGTQSFVADGAAVEGDVTRDGYSVTSAPVQIAKTDSGAFSNDVNGTVQWPFPTGVPISSGFGARQVAGCSFCSTFHQGLDFTPGSGTPIQSIADGVVTKVDGPSGALGNNVWIEHTIDGTKVTSVYAHMQTGSVEVTKGQRVSVGDIVGKVGSTGNSTGAHLHFEIIVGGVPIDPYPWLTTNAN